MGVLLDLQWRKKVQLPWKRLLNFFPILRKGGKGRAKEKVLEVKKVMEEKEKEMVVVRPVAREKEEREVKEVIPTAQVQCHQLRLSWPRHRILLQLRFVCSPPWAGLTVTW